MPLAKPARPPRTNYMPSQNLKENPKTDYMPCNTCVPYCYLIIFRSSHRHIEHNLDTHNTTLTSTGMGGQTYHHPGKAHHLHQQPWEDQPTTMSKNIQHLHQQPWEEQPTTMLKNIQYLHQ